MKSVRETTMERNEHRAGMSMLGGQLPALTYGLLVSKNCYVAIKQ
jgi:hypothetical protein